MQRLTDQQRQLAESWIAGMIDCLHNHIPWVFHYLPYEDAKSLGYLILVRCAKDYDPAKGRFGNFLYKSMKNSMSDACKIHKTRTSKNSIYIDYAINNLPLELHEDFDGNLRRADLRKQLRELMDMAKLTDLERRVIQAYMEGVTIKEQVRIRGVTHQTIQARKANAIMKMQHVARTLGLECATV